MKQLATLLMVIPLLFLMGCAQTETDKAIGEFRTALMDVKKLTDGGVSYNAYSEQMKRLGASMTLAKGRIFESQLNERQRKEMAILSLVSMDYVVVQVLWLESLASDVTRQNDIAIVDGDLLPTGIDKIALREESRKTAKRVFDKEDGPFQGANKYVLPQSTAFSIYWVHADTLLGMKVK